MTLEPEQAKIIFDYLKDWQTEKIKQAYKMKFKKLDHPTVMISWYFRVYPKYDSFLEMIMLSHPTRPDGHSCPNCYEEVDSYFEKCPACGQVLDWSER